MNKSRWEIKIFMLKEENMFDVFIFVNICGIILLVRK